MPCATALGWLPGTALRRRSTSVSQATWSSAAMCIGPSQWYCGRRVCKSSPPSCMARRMLHTAPYHAAGDGKSWVGGAPAASRMIGMITQEKPAPGSNAFWGTQSVRPASSALHSAAAAARMMRLQGRGKKHAPLPDAALQWRELH